MRPYGASTTTSPTVGAIPAGTLVGPQVRTASDLPLKKSDRLRPFDNSTVGSRGLNPDPPDDRWTRPNTGDVHTHPDAGAPPPHHHYYRTYYTGWYCHPWYRYTHWTTAVVWFGFGVNPWGPAWIPPSRYGWSWVPGYWYYGYWHPGYWRPLAPIPIGYVYVPGWWQTEVVYVEGFYRQESREGWRWVDGQYLDDGTYVRGHWLPRGTTPAGYTWVPGFWNGDQWLEGFWRPEFRSGYRWVEGYYDADGLFVAGYWEPIEDVPGHIWVPGWFDGSEWVEGYWISEKEMDEERPEDWVPEQGVPSDVIELPADAPLAMPVVEPEPHDAVEEAPEPEGDEPERKVTAPGR